MTTLTVFVRVITTVDTCNIHMTTLTVFVKVITVRIYDKTDSI